MYYTIWSIVTITNMLRQLYLNSVRPYFLQSDINFLSCNMEQHFLVNLEHSPRFRNAGQIISLFFLLKVRLLFLHRFLNLMRKISEVNEFRKFNDDI